MLRYVIFIGIVTVMTSLTIAIFTRDVTALYVALALLFIAMLYAAWMLSGVIVMCMEDMRGWDRSSTPPSRG